ALQRLADERFDPRTEVVLSPHPEARALEGPAISVPAKVERPTPEYIRAEVDAPASGYLVVSEAIAPGWQAWIDGRPAPLLRANYLFQSVPVSPGRRVVELRYEPPGFALGLQLSGFSLVCLLVLTVADVTILSRRARGHRGEIG